MAKEGVVDELIETGLIIGSIILGVSFLRSLSDKNKEGANYGAGTQPPIY